MVVLVVVVVVVVVVLALLCGIGSCIVSVLPPVCVSSCMFAWRFLLRSPGTLVTIHRGGRKEKYWKMRKDNFYLIRILSDLIAQGLSFLHSYIINSPRPFILTYSSKNERPWVI